MGKIGFRVLLAALGVLLRLGCSVSQRFRAQITADVVIEVRAGDGVVHHYAFTADPRRMSSHAGPAPGEPDLSLSFASSGLGFVTLIRPDAIGRTITLILAGKASYEGNATLVLWFWGLTRMVLPLGLQRPLKQPLPGALTAPDPASKVADQITRRPVAGAIDPQWAEGVAGQRKMPMVRACLGERIPMW